MNITDELLAAYAEGNVSESERKTVRQYLINNPAELETLLPMMDEDYELDLSDEDAVDDVYFEKNNRPFSEFCYSAAAFTPQIVPIKKTIKKHYNNDNKNFNQHLGDLLDEIMM